MASVNIEHHDVINCSRCGQDHKQVAFFEFTGNPIEDKDGTTWNFWAYCPKFVDPILMNKAKKEDEQDMANPIYAKLQEMAEENQSLTALLSLFVDEGITVDLSLVFPDDYEYKATTCDKTFYGETAWSALWQAWAHYYEFVKEHETPKYTVMRLSDGSSSTWIKHIKSDGVMEFDTHQEAQDAAIKESGFYTKNIFRIQMPDGSVLPPIYFSGKQWVHKKGFWE